MAALLTSSSSIGKRMIPNNFPYPRSHNVQLFDYFGSLSVGAGVSQTIITWTVPNQVKQGYLTMFGQGLDTPSQWSTAIWAIRVNGVPQQYYSLIQDQLAEFTDPKDIAPIVIRGSDIVSVTVSNGSGASGLYGSRLKGFYDFGGTPIK